MSVATLKAALITALKTVEGFETGGRVIGHIPRSISNGELISVTLLGYNGRRTAGQVTLTHWQFRCRLYIPWQTPDGAEARLDALAEEIPLAVERHAQLYQAIVSGLAEAPEATSGFTTVGEAQCRAYDVTVSILDKQASTVIP